MTIEIELPSWIGRERYFLIDADGKAEIHGYHQRPTAERRAQQGGYGLYDRRENRLVIPIDYDKRVQRHKDDVARKLHEYQEAQERSVAILKAREEAMA